MADDRKPAGAESAAAETAPAAAGGGVKAWLPLIIAVVLMPALAFGMTKFVIVPELQKSLGIKEPVESGSSAKGKSSRRKKNLCAV